LLVIGLGSGRCGSHSLQKLLNAHNDCLFFHEINHRLLRFEGSKASLKVTLDGIRAFAESKAEGDLIADLSKPENLAVIDSVSQKNNIQFYGDIAHFYLGYVNEILSLYPNTKFICLKRDKTETINSWLNKVKIRKTKPRKILERLRTFFTGRKYYNSKNRWQEHNGDDYMIDLEWDKCFPNYQADSMEEAVRLYWEDYYRRAEEFAKCYPEQFVIMDIEALNSAKGQQEIYAFIGIEAEIESHVKVHEDKLR
jgi:hypothetical protein